MDIFDKTMKKASLIMIAITIVSSSIFYFIPNDSIVKISIENELLSILLQVCYVFFVIWLIVVNRGDTIEKTATVNKLNVINYIWRAYLIKYISLALGVLVMAFVFKPIPSIQHTIIAFIFQFLFSFLIAWLFLSRKKLETIKRLIFSIRGY